MLRILEYWNRDSNQVLNKKDDRSAWRKLNLIVCCLFVAIAIGLDCATGVRYNPTLIYVILIMYVSWNAPAPLAAIVVAVSVVGMTVAALIDPAFFVDAVPAIDLLTQVSTVILLGYALIRFRALTLRLFQDQQARVDQQRQRNEQQRVFVAALSHEFRTPLNGIAGQAQRLAATRETISAEQLTTRTESILNAVRRIQKLVDTILMSEKIEQSQVVFCPSLVDVAALVTRVCRHHQEIGVDGRLTVSIDDPPPLTMADEPLLELALDNLLTNAIKYSVGSAAIDVVCRHENSVIIVSVSDQGRGITAEDLPVIFCKYFRGRNVERIPGFGIGLYLASNIVHLHGGELAVASESGSGSTFTIRLPQPGGHECTQGGLA